MQIVVRRMRPSIGDALMLGPAILGLRKKYNADRVSVVTDGSYMNGALVDAFNMLDGVDEVFNGHRGLEVRPNTPYLDCDDAFLQYEAVHHGNPPLGIAEYWLRHFGVTASTLRPRLHRALYRVSPPEKQVVGIVLAAGHPARNWNVDKLLPALEHRLYAQNIDWQLIGQAQTERFRDVPRELNKCSVIITPDTSILHLAGALGIPTVSLWGVIDPRKRVGPYQTLTLPETPRGRCGDPTCPCCRMQQNYSCMHSFTVDEIYNATMRMLN